MQALTCFDRRTRERKNDEAVGQSDMTAEEVRDAAAAWLEAGVVAGWTQKTISDRQAWLDRLAEYLEAENRRFDTEGLRSWLAALRTGTERRSRRPLGPHSMDHVDRLLRAFTSWLLKQERLDADPMTKLPRPIVRDDSIRVPTQDALAAAFAAAREGRYPERDVAALAIMVDAGLRASELAALRIQDVDLRYGWVCVRNGKGGKPRNVPIGRHARDAIRIYLALQRNGDPPDSPLFISERGLPLCPDALRHIMGRLRTRGGIEGRLHPHMLRHYAATEFLRGGGPWRHVMALLGHSSAAATMRYVRVTDDDVKASHETASPFNRLSRRLNVKPRAPRGKSTLAKRKARDARR